MYSYMFKPCSANIILLCDKLVKKMKEGDDDYVALNILEWLYMCENCELNEWNEAIKDKNVYDMYYHLCIKYIE